MPKRGIMMHMNLSVGIVGLPNVGKSTLFNALLKKQQALAANYPFATIEPNIGIVAVPDQRLEKLAEITKEEEKMSSLPPLKPATVEFVDIAGLVKGASEGAGLGNKFLSHIREVSVIAHVVRAFTDDNIIREGSSDPENDYATIQMELMIADMQTVEKALSNRKLPPMDKQVLEHVASGLNSGIPVRDRKVTDEEAAVLKQYFLLSAKPEIIVLNISEDEYSLMNVEMLVEKYANILQHPRDKFVVICAKIEAELAALSEEEQKVYLEELGFPNSGLERLIQKAYDRLGLISFLTAGEKEVRAWTVRKGASAPEAAGEIHTDFIKKFIKAEVVGFEDFIQNNGWKSSRDHGKARLEGKEYIMKDGDVVEFKIGA
jgi:ribosome-binding ATPase